ncbi:MAG TPA: ABC transporter ATP-binding protein [Solirubrobacterales bacterium]|nr:ABC transporter ATP-binding protein [Solirubrobacterales bacterium]
MSEAEATSESQPRSGASSVSYEGASKRYGNSGALAVDQLTLEVPAGEICVLVGPSGCGKTTAMRMVNRTVEMTAGDILVGGESVRDREPARLRREIGYVIQQIGLFPHRTIAENIAAVPQLLGWKKERTRQRTAELLELIGLDPELGERYPAQLSGGQQQRVGVARALAADPLVMLMDEPFGAIDPISRERLQNEFLRLQAQVRKTVLFVTHDIDEAIKMGDRIAIMKEGGKVEQYATPAEILMAPATEFVEDFVGADRALKRLALMRVADIDLWKAPLAHVGQATAEVRAKLAEPDVEVPYPLLVDSERRPLGWLSERDLRAETVPSRPDSPLGPLLDRDDVMRDALADLLQGEAQYAAVVDAEGRIDGVLSVEIISEFLKSPEAKSDEHSAVERPLSAERASEISGDDERERAKRESHDD